MIFASPVALFPILLLAPRQGTYLLPETVRGASAALLRVGGTYLCLNMVAFRYCNVSHKGAIYSTLVYPLHLFSLVCFFMFYTLDYLRYLLCPSISGPNELTLLSLIVYSIFITLLI